MGGMMMKYFGYSLLLAKWCWELYAIMEDMEDMGNFE